MYLLLLHFISYNNLLHVNLITYVTNHQAFIIITSINTINVSVRSQWIKYITYCFEFLWGSNYKHTFLHVFHTFNKYRKISIIF